MNTFKAVFFHVMTFVAGGMAFSNINLLVESGAGYTASWVNVATFIGVGMLAATATHSRR